MPLSEIDSLPKVYQQFEYKLNVNDKISVSVDQHPDLSIGSIFEVYNSDAVYGKWVLIDMNGEAILPKIGKVKLAGLSTREAELLITNRLSEYIVTPIVVVKVHNWEVSVVGEVISPGAYTIEKMNNSVIEYITKAGGLDAYANKKNIKLIRNNGQQPQVITIDFTDYSDLTATQLNLMPGDIIYIPTTRGKKLDQRSSTLLPFASFISALAIVITLL